MIGSKELFIQEHERICAELEDQGMDPDMAYERACDLADEAVIDRLADAADYARMLAKEGRQ